MATLLDAAYLNDVQEPDVSRLSALIPHHDAVIGRIGPQAKIFLVGGAVRDCLLHQPVVDKDYVVVGSDVPAMLAAGFIPVGKDFPVFLHPVTHEEYALARTERKSGTGYKGFLFNADPTVTLEEDLSRRDLTINAMAIDIQGHLIDPFHGADDLRNKIFRHVGPAFSEDPVRLLRLARFSARFPDFNIAPDTYTLCKALVASGETQALVAERVWQELSKGLSEQRPSRMIQTLLACDAWPSVTKADAPDAISLAALDQAAARSAPDDVRAALLLRAISSSAEPGRSAQSLRAPKDAQALAQALTAGQALVPHVSAMISSRSAASTAAATLLDWLELTDALRRPERFADLLVALQCRSELTPEVAQTLSDIVAQLLAPDRQSHIADTALAAQQSSLPIAQAVRQERIRLLQEILLETI